MADRKITELSEAASVASGDVMVVVTGVDGGTLTTNKFPLSGLVNNIVNIDELVTPGTGVYLNFTYSDTAKNTVSIETSGLAYTSHTHEVADITNFSSGVSGEVQQLIKFQTEDIAATGMLLASGDLKIPLEANSKYVCQLGTIFENDEENSKISGLVNVTGTMEVNYSTNMYGSWTYLNPGTNGHGTVINSLSPISGYGLVVNTLDADASGIPITLVNNFVVETTNSEADTLTFQFQTDSADQATSGVLKKGSWFKAEKVI